MPKLINADRMIAEESEAYMNVQLRIKDETTKLINKLVHKKIQMLLADAPAEDVVTVIRCRNCSYYCTNGMCNRSHDFVMPEGFCYRGEKK